MDEPGCLPFSASSGALLFNLLSKLYERKRADQDSMETPGQVLGGNQQ